MGRPISFYASDDLVERIKREAAKDKRTLSNWVVVALEEVLDELEDDEPNGEDKRAE